MFVLSAHPEYYRSTLNATQEEQSLARRNLDHMRFQVRKIGRYMWDNLFTERPEFLSSTYLEARAKSRTLSLSFETPQRIPEIANRIHAVCAARRVSGTPTPFDTFLVRCPAEK